MVKLGCDVYSVSIKVMVAGGGGVLCYVAAVWCIVRCPVKFCSLQAQAQTGATKMLERRRSNHRTAALLIACLFLVQAHAAGKFYYSIIPSQIPICFLSDKSSSIIY